MPNETADMLGAITASLTSDAPTELETPADGGETPAGETPASEEQPSGEQPEGEAPAGAEEEAAGEEEATEGEGGDEEELDENGQPKAKEPPPRKADPLNDAIPKGTLQRTQERITSLIGMVKERDTKITTLEKTASNYNELVETISGTGLDAPRFNAMLQYADWVNNGGIEGQEKAYDFMLGELKALAKAIGRTVPGEHPLQGHQDLIDEVDAKTMTPERAIELAEARNRQAARGRFQQTAHEASSREQGERQMQAQVTAAITKLGKDLAARDGVDVYKKKMAILVPQIKDDLQDVAPQKRVAYIQRAYDRLTLPKAAPAAKTPPASQQPLRGNKQPAGHGSKQANTMLGAVTDALKDFPG